MSDSQRYVLVNTVAGFYVCEAQTMRLMASALSKPDAELIVRALNDQDSTELVELRTKLREQIDIWRAMALIDGSNRFFANELERILDGDAG
jgi:hypothetical protein